MKARTVLAALALALTPGLASAMCGGEGHIKTSSPCGEGMVWDAAAGICTAPVHS